MRGFFLDFSQQSKIRSKKANTPSEWGTKHFNAPPKEGTEHWHSLTMYRGALPSKIDFLVPFSMEKGLYSLSNDLSSSKLVF
jgi:uncharacterized protein YdaL